MLAIPVGRWRGGPSSLYYHVLWSGRLWRRGLWLALLWGAVDVEIVATLLVVS